MIINAIDNISKGIKVDDKYFILMTRLIVELSIEAYNLKLKIKLNQNN